MGPQRDDSVVRVTVLQATGPEFRYQHSYIRLGVAIILLYPQHCGDGDWRGSRTWWLPI